MLKYLMILILSGCPLALAQTNPSADQQKIIDIEQQLAATTGSPGDATVKTFQKYLYDGQDSLVDQFGRHYRMTKADIVGMVGKPDPTDPDAKSVYKVSDFQIDIYDDTALASYSQIATDSGHKNAALDGDTTTTCLDTFIKHSGQWYALASSCTPTGPMSQARWDAIAKK